MKIFGSGNLFDGSINHLVNPAYTIYSAEPSAALKVLSSMF